MQVSRPSHRHDYDHQVLDGQLHRWTAVFFTCLGLPGFTMLIASVGRGLHAEGHRSWILRRRSRSARRLKRCGIQRDCPLRNDRVQCGVSPGGAPDGHTDEERCGECGNGGGRRRRSADGRRRCPRCEVTRNLPKSGSLTRRGVSVWRSRPGMHAEELVPNAIGHQCE